MTTRRQFTGRLIAAGALANFATVKADGNNGDNGKENGNKCNNPGKDDMCHGNGAKSDGCPGNAKFSQDVVPAPQPSCKTVKNGSDVGPVG